jgi:hypothetical protein
MSEENQIGGYVKENEAFEGFADIPQNRVLLVEKLTSRPPVTPEVKQDLTSIDDVFDHFKPSIEMDFENEEGATKKETLHFTSIGDFGLKGLTNQSAFLNDLTAKKEQYQKVIKQLKSNKTLRQALSDPASRQNVINALNAMISELDQSK